MNIDLDAIMIFSKAKDKFIEELEEEIENIYQKLQVKFKASIKHKTAYDLNTYLFFTFYDIEENVTKLKDLFFVINNLNKLYNQVELQQTKNEKTGKKIAPKITNYSLPKYNAIPLHIDMTAKEIEEVNKISKEISKEHWSEKIKIKYSFMHDLGDSIINRDHKKFYDLMNSILNNKAQASKYTKKLFGKSVKHKTKEELKKENIKL